MKAIPLHALAACLAVAACRSATSTASLAPARPAPAAAPLHEAPEALPVVLARAAQEPPPASELEEVGAIEESAEPDGWRLILTPTLFLAGANGAVEVDDDGDDIASESRDLFDSPDLGIILGLELGHEDSIWKGLGELMYLRTEEDGQGPGGVSSEHELDQFLAELDLILELQPDGLVDLLFGARFWSVSADVTSDPGGPGEVNANGSETWVDPVIGLRSRLPLGASLDAILRGDVAGFGLGSEFSSHLAAGLDWSFDESLALGFGYRQYYVNYSAAVLDYDYKVGGLYLGLTWRL